MRLPSPWLQGIVGAVALGGIAAARLTYESEHRAAPAPRAAAAAAARLVVVETEPNDTAGAAQPIARLPVEVRGELLAGDRDVFRFRIDEPGAHLIAAWMEGAARARLRVTRADGSELTSAETPERIGALALIRGDYFVTLEAATKGSYRLMVEKRPWVRGLDWEPNDDPDHALELARLEPSATLETGANEIARYRAVGWWSRRSDVDCYRVPLLVPPTGADFRIELVPPVGVKAHLVVYDTGDPGARINPQRLIDVTGTVAGERTIVPALGERSWQPEYTMCVDSGGGENFMDSYTLEIRAFTPKGPFEFEPNDTRRTASALPRDVRCLAISRAAMWTGSESRPRRLRACALGWSCRPGFRRKSHSSTRSAESASASGVRRAAASPPMKRPSLSSSCARLKVATRKSRIDSSSSLWVLHEDIRTA